MLNLAHENSLKHRLAANMTINVQSNNSDTNSYFSWRHDILFFFLIF